MAKKAAKPEPASKSTESNVAAPVIESAAEREPINMNTPTIQSAIAQGKVLIAEGKSKADAARAIFAGIKDEPKDVIVAAFVEGATLTPKGALTYWYNNKRRASKERKQD
jgi:6-phosphogluconolactonase/glucosamine-6-phosphate isomerase/deaminase